MAFTIPDLDRTDYLVIMGGNPLVSNGSLATAADFPGKLKALRKRFIEEAKETFGIDYSGMDPETQEGELYIDSLAVPAAFRGKGIAKMLLKAVIEKGREMGLPAVGLLVDKGNPKAERLYADMGFEYVNDAVWGGHSMKHLQYPLR